MVAGWVARYSIVAFIDFRSWIAYFRSQLAGNFDMRGMLKPAGIALAVLLSFSVCWGQRGASRLLDRADTGLTRGTNAHDEECRKVFESVKNGLAQSNVSAFSGQMAPQVYINLRGGESGYFSASQAYYVLEGFMRNRRLLYVDFSSYGDSGAMPYATGSVAFNIKGSRETAQVYVSLTRHDGRWLVAQINIH